MGSVYVIRFRDVGVDNSDGVLRVYRDAGRAAQDLELLNALPGEANTFAIDELPIFDDAVPSPPAPVDKPKEKAPVRKRCADAMRQWLKDTAAHHEPFDFDDVALGVMGPGPKSIYRTVTIRAALGDLVDYGELFMTKDGQYDHVSHIGRMKPSRAGNGSPEPERSPPLATDAGAGAVSESDAPIEDIPNFLKRDKMAAE